MTDIFPQGQIDDLTFFAETVWGNAQAVTKRSEGIEFIHLQTPFLAFQLLFRGALQDDKILIRDEYRTTLQELQTGTYYRGAYVTGQPGIGKTLFLIYLLVANLGQRRVVAVQLSNGRPFYALFKDRVTIHSLNDTKPLFGCSRVWALVDSNDMVECPSGIFTGIPSVVQVVQTTPPKASRWKEWSKQTGAQRYVMDIWTKKEIVDLAKLLGWDVVHTTALARKWGGVPRTLREYALIPEWRVEGRYRSAAGGVVQKSSVMMAAAAEFDVPDNMLSRFYFVRPLMTAEGIVRQEGRLCVPTPTLCHLLAETLKEQNNRVRLDFFNALSQPNETRAAAGFIYESWFHSFFSSAKLESINCYWQGLGSMTPLQGTDTLIPSTLEAPRSKTPPYYWVAPKGFLGIDSALVLEKEIFVFQVTLHSEHSISPIDGMRKLQSNLPNNLRNIPWNVVFVGPDGDTVKAVAEGTHGIFFPTDQTPARIGWSMVDPVQKDITYKVFHDESEPDEMMVDDEAGD